jgi:hypothetical protein
MAPEAQNPSQWPCLTKLPSEMCSQPIVSKALSRGTSRKDTSMLADIPYRKSQIRWGNLLSGYFKMTCKSVW